MSLSQGRRLTRRAIMRPEHTQIENTSGFRLATHPLTRSGRMQYAPTLWWLLAVLFLGPLVAPLFQATGLPLVAGSGPLAHDLLARYVCPTPAKSYALLGFPMAGCARCWGATIGLWPAWLLFQRLQIADCRLQIREGQFVICSAYLAMPWVARLGLAGVAFVLWALEIHMWPG